MSGPQRQENDKLVDWVRKYKACQDDESFQEIVKALHGYLQHLSLKKFYHIPGHNSDDVYQEGLRALYEKAIPDYREEKGAFMSFAKLCIRRHIITVLKSSNNGKQKPLNGSMSLDYPTGKRDEDGPVPVSGLLSTGDEDIVELFGRVESHTRLKAALLEKLTPLEARVLDCYLQNMSYLNIVEAMNKNRRGKNRVDPKVVDNALCRIKKKAAEIERELSRQRKAVDNALCRIKKKARDIDSELKRKRGKSASDD